jgi:4'-phosphopantetheinyl transferase
MESERAPMRRYLDAGDIHIWCSLIADIVDPSLWVKYRALLSEPERAQEPRFYFDRDRRSYLVTRALVRTVLSRYCDVAPKDWAFTQNRYGRPAISKEFEDARRIAFNVSHTQGLVILAVSSGRELGVDTENISVRQGMAAVADRFFSEREVKALRAAPESARERCFFELWTLKESYIKARGMGLSIPLNNFSFRFHEDASIQLSFDPAEQDSPGRWRFWQWQLEPDHLIALCAERGEFPDAEVLLKRVVPLIAEHKMAPRLVRATRPLTGRLDKGLSLG